MARLSLSVSVLDAGRNERCRDRPSLVFPQGYFTGASAVMVRKVVEKAPTVEEKPKGSGADELMADFDDEEENQEPEVSEWAERSLLRCVPSAEGSSLACRRVKLRNRRTGSTRMK